MSRSHCHAAYADAGVEPIDFPEAPTFALPIALEKAGLKVDDIAQFEINEAFSVVVRIAEKKLGIDPAKINPLGLVPLVSQHCVHELSCLSTAAPSRSAMPSATPARVSSSPSSTH